MDGRNVNECGGEPLYFYRGVRSKDYKNVPGIYRDADPDENYYYHEIRVRCPAAFRALDHLETLTYMQHYGCPTRLLDITSNPLVALYFACSAGNQNENNSDGKVYAFRLKSKELCYPESDRILLLSELAQFTAREQRSIRDIASQCIFEALSGNGNGGGFPLENGRYRDLIVERYYQTVRHDNGAFEREILPYDLLTPAFVQPNKDNPRILKQDGAFIMFGLDSNEDYCHRKAEKYVIEEMIIPSDCKGGICRELESVGISQASLFPEVDQVADYLKRKKRSSRI